MSKQIEVTYVIEEDYVLFNFPNFPLELIGQGLIHENKNQFGLASSNVFEIMKNGIYFPGRRDLSDLSLTNSSSSRKTEVLNNKVFIVMRKPEIDLSEKGPFFTAFLDCLNEYNKALVE